MLSKIAIASLFASLVAAQSGVLPNGDPVNPTIAPIDRESVAACKPYTVTWTPNTAGPLKVTLLIGSDPANLAIGDDLAVGIPNSGSWTWTPSASLPGTTGGRGYGLKITDIPTGLFQYTPNFALNKDACGSAPVSSSVKPASSSANGYPVSTPVKPTSSAIGYPVSTSDCSTSAPPKTTVVYNTAPAGNHTVIQPTAPTTLQSYPTSATTSHLPQVSGNAAPALQAGAGLIGAMAVFALML